MSWAVYRYFEIDDKKNFKRKDIFRIAPIY